MSAAWRQLSSTKGLARGGHHRVGSPHRVRLLLTKLLRFMALPAGFGSPPSGCCGAALLARQVSTQCPKYIHLIHMNF